jgi:hypothetical protein
MISPTGLADWDCLTVLFDSPPAIRRVIYYDQHDRVVELHVAEAGQNTRRLPERQGHCKTAVCGATTHRETVDPTEWDWKTAPNQFMILFGERALV